MSCRSYRALVSEALDDAVTRDETRLLEAHLALCRACSEHRRDLSEMRLLLRSERAIEPGPALEDELFARVRACDEGGLSWLWRLVKHVLPPPRLWSRTAVLGLLVLALGRVMTEPVAVIAPPPLPGATILDAGALLDPGLLTVWDSQADRIIATVDPDGLASEDLLQRASVEAERAAAATTGSVMQVRIVLFQRIVVRG